MNLDNIADLAFQELEERKYSDGLYSLVRKTFECSVGCMMKYGQEDVNAVRMIGIWMIGRHTETVTRFLDSPYNLDDLNELMPSHITLENILVLQWHLMSKVDSQRHAW